MCGNPQLVFDAADFQFERLWFPATGLIFVAISSLLLWNDLREPQNKRSWRTVFMFGFSILWTLLALVGTLSGSGSARSDLSSGNFQTVEGPVENFVPQPYGGHANERFTVAGKVFSYSDFHMTAGFHQSRSHGGPIDAGVQVRIAYSGETILRLEVCR